MRGICDRCGFEYDHADLRKEWTGLMVCAADFDRKPAELRPPRLRPEGLPVPNARPEQPITVVDGAPVTDEAEDPLWFLR